MKSRIYWCHSIMALALAEKLGHETPVVVNKWEKQVPSKYLRKEAVEVKPLKPLKERDGAFLIDSPSWGGNHCASRSTPWSVLRWRRNGVAEEWLCPPGHSWLQEKRGGGV